MLTSTFPSKKIKDTDNSLLQQDYEKHKQTKDLQAEANDGIAGRKGADGHLWLS